MRQRIKTAVFTAGRILLLIAVFAVAKVMGAGTPTIIVILASAGLAICAIVSILRFRSRRTTAGAAWAVAAVLLILVDLKASQVRKMMSTPFAMPPTAVSSAVVTAEDWAPMLSAVGSVSAVQGAMVSTELGGVVAEVAFQNGGVAKKGDLLVKLDASAEEGLLKNAQADLELARANLDRAHDLATRKVVSKQELDAAEAQFGQKQGTVDNIQALLRKKQVLAPFDGQLGIRQVNVGQMINAGQQVVALTALDPVYVDFAMPQQELSRLTEGLDVTVRTDAVRGKEFKGKLTAIDSMVDSVTRNVSIQATLANPDHTLRPGMFVKAWVDLPDKHKTLVIPGSAVSYAPYGDSVFVIEKQKDPKSGKESETLRQQVVRVGQARGDFVAVSQGVKEGETIVSTGVFKLRNGMTVFVKNDLAPKPELNPNPPDS
ncbi:MAG: efflux RND transporter periplasmic adaptor subunit [Chthoniobacterales bacterium]